MLQKQAINLNFSKGLDLKSDPYQVPLGNFLRLQNSVFNKAGRLTKRNGYQELTSLVGLASYLTTFQGNLTAVSNQLQAYVEGSNKWSTKGSLQPVKLSTLSLVRNNNNQTQLDSAVSTNNMVCTAYSETVSGSTVYKYVLSDSTTSQNILPPAVIPCSGTQVTAPRVFYIGQYFVVVFGTATTLQFISINTSNPVAPTSSTQITSQYSYDTRLNFDGCIANNQLYIAWNGSDVGGAIRITYLDSGLTQHNTSVSTGQTANILSVCADTSGSTANIYVNYWNATNNNIYLEVFSHGLTPVLLAPKVLDTRVITNLTASANNNLETVYYEIPNNYSYDSAIPSHYVYQTTCTLSGTAGTPSVFARSVGLASKSFVVDGSQYVIGVYYSATQPTYFLLNSQGQVVSRFAYSNGGGYKTTGLPGVVVSGSTAYVGYQYADQLVAVNTSQGVPAPNGTYAQTGLNLMEFSFGIVAQSAEIGNTLSLTGGFLWTYDGVAPIENNFFVWPDNIEVTTATTGGNLTAQQYFYQVIYEWWDNQGNPYRSAPSIPVSVTTTGSTSANTINIPTLRLTYKTNVKISIFRFSAGQQEYFEITSINNPLLNNPAVDSIQFVDTQADTAILGNSLIYTTGGVVEDVGAPSFNALTLFDSRLWGIDAEDPNLLWYSKQVIEGTPVEMSDLFTVYVEPSISAQGLTGPMTCLAPMDDKLVIFKQNAMYYINGSGPDNTGANSQYSQPTFIASVVGSINQYSIVFTPEGLMFQSDKGIWLLNRSLQTTYIGAPVEDLTLGTTVTSAVNIPETNQVRFSLSSGVTLMYDYYYGQWGTFSNVSAVSSTIYQSLHTYIDSYGRVFQENPGSYVDGTLPVLQGFTTSWINAAGLQGYERGYWLHLLGTYYSPHKLSVQIAYDYNPNPQQQTYVLPNNYSGPWGQLPTWGAGQTWGGSTNVEEARVFFAKQKCSSFQVIIDEVFDPSYGTVAGEGLSLSGVDMTIGIKKSYRPQSAAKSFG